MIYIGKLHILPEKEDTDTQTCDFFLFEALSCFFKKHDIEETALCMIFSGILPDNLR